ERTWHQKVTQFIALSDFARERFIAGGLPGDKISVKPNVVFAHEPTTLQPRSGALYVGRLSAEKGVLDMIEAWKTIDCPLTIAGDGPLGPQLRAASTPNVTFLGNVSRERVNAEMHKAAVLIAPSICYENFPLAIAEAFACRLPAIVSGMGAMAEIVEDGRTGLHFKPHTPEDLADKVRFALTHEETLRGMGEEAYRFYERHLSPSANIKSLLAIYARALGHGATDQVAVGQRPHEPHLREYVA
ncbi:MAG: glycosyltransferase family 4 protein, partial [Hyphomicrobium sp.]